MVMGQDMSDDNGLSKDMSDGHRMPQDKLDGDALLSDMAEVVSCYGDTADGVGNGQLGWGVEDGRSTDLKKVSFILK